MVIKVEVQESILENTYFYIDEKSHHGFLIDPGAEANKILSLIQENGWVIESILLTHGHFDHIGAVEDIRKTLSCEVLGYEGGDLYLLNPYYNLSSFFGEPIILDGVKKINEKKEICLKSSRSFSLKVLHTPGHTKDSCVFYNDKVAFVGDTLFKDGVGNTSFPLGDEAELWNSIKNKIFCLPESIVVYPGHGEDTLISIEKKRYQ